jgi:hypothetical protein
MVWTFEFWIQGRASMVVFTKHDGVDYHYHRNYDPGMGLTINTTFHTGTSAHDSIVVSIILDDDKIDEIISLDQGWDEYDAVDQMKAVISKHNLKEFLSKLD